MHRKLRTLLLGGTLLLGSLSPLPVANAQVINAQGQPSADYNVSWQKGNDDAARECANGYVPQYKPAPTLPYANASEAYDAGYNNGLDYSQPCLKVKYNA